MLFNYQCISIYNPFRPLNQMQKKNLQLCGVCDKIPWLNQWLATVANLHIHQLYMYPEPVTKYDWQVTDIRCPRTKRGIIKFKLPNMKTLSSSPTINSGCTVPTPKLTCRTSGPWGSRLFESGRLNDKTHKGRNYYIHTPVPPGKYQKNRPLTGTVDGLTVWLATLLLLPWTRQFPLLTLLAPQRLCLSLRKSWGMKNIQ